MAGPRRGRIVGDGRASLWRCPVCGQRFVTRNMPHSCEVPVARRVLRGRQARARDLFDRFVAAVRGNGEVTVNVTKSRVALQVADALRGSSGRARTTWWRASSTPAPIRERSSDPRRVRAAVLLRTPVQLRSAEDIDAELARWLAQAYQVGAQRHVTDPDWPKLRRPPSWVHLPREVADAIARGEDPSTVR